MINKSIVVIFGINYSHNAGAYGTVIVLICVLYCYMYVHAALLTHTIPTDFKYLRICGKYMLRQSMLLCT